jgi:hypothetical protein
MIVLALWCALLDVSTARGQDFPLIVNGSPSLDVWWEAGLLTVRFRRSGVAAGQPANYDRLHPGTAAWVDRPLNAKEPTTLKQKMTKAQAQTAVDRLRQNGGYWRFFCHTDPAGFLEASRSEAAYHTVTIDPGSRNIPAHR